VKTPLLALTLALTLALSATVRAGSQTPYLVKSFEGPVTPDGAVGERVYFGIGSPAGGQVLWTSTGTGDSTRPVPVPAAAYPSATPMTSLGEVFLFTQANGVWTTDGSVAGTRQLSPYDAAGYLAVRNGDRVFYASSFLEPMRTDGTPQGTYGVPADQFVMVSPLNGGTTSSFGSGFAFTDRFDPPGFWRTEGLPGTTRFVPIGRPPHYLKEVDTRLFLASVSTTPGPRLWVSDGTSDGTLPLAEVYARRMTAVHGVLYFERLLGPGPGELWRSDGTPGGTGPLAARVPLPADLTAQILATSNGILYFLGETAASGRELWRTDGTAAGTFMLRDIEPGPGSGLPAPDGFYGNVTATTFAGGLFFAASTGATGLEVWTTDGTPAGTVPLPELVPGPASATPAYFQVAGGRVFFGANLGGPGAYGLWAIDLPRGLVSVEGVRVTEGESGVIASFPVRLNAPATEAVAVSYATESGTAEAGFDFTPVSGALTFAPGTIETTVDVAVVGDLRDEADEWFALRLAPLGGAMIAEGRGVAVVLDDDAPVARIASAIAVLEGDTGATDADFSVTLTTRDGSRTEAPITVPFVTADGSAYGEPWTGDDYDSTSGTLTFPAGTASGSSLTVTVPIQGDTADEPDESFFLRLQPHGSAAVDAAPVRGTILDDDGTPSVPLVELSHGGAVRASLESPPGGFEPRDFYVLRQERYASYEVLVDEVSGDAVPIQLERLDQGGAGVLQSAAPVGTGGSVSLRWRAYALFETAPDVVLRVRSVACGTSCGAEDTYRVRAYETTLTAPRFNNMGAQRSVLVLQNASSDSVTGQYQLWGDDGGLWSQSPPFPLPAHGTVLVDTATENGGRSGSITVTHDGRYGTVTGKVVALEPATGFAFDTPLTSKPR
jgi:ELWxxDGT repeat protein